MLVRMAVKSTALSVVNSWPTIVRPCFFASLVNSSARPWPKAVRSSMTPTFFTFSSLAAYTAIAPPIWLSLAMMRYRFL
jgi:hypothetical protein